MKANIHMKHAASLINQALRLECVQAGLPVHVEAAVKH